MRCSRRWPLLAGVLARLWAAAAPAAAEAPPFARYVIDAHVSVTPPQVHGTLTVRFTNRSARLLSEAVFVLFPNRFATPDAAVDDFNRPFVYPEQTFDPGGIDVETDVGGSTPVDDPRLPRGCALRVPIAPLAPGSSTTIALRFRTIVPHRFGSFGEYDGQLTLVGGWYPYLAALSDAGEWQLDAPPPLADFEVTLTPTDGLQAVLSDRLITSTPPVAAQDLGALHYVTLVAAADFVRETTALDAGSLTLLRRPPRRSSRISLDADPTQTLLATLQDIVRRRPASLPPPAGGLVVVQAPLRLALTAASEGTVVVSDRALKVHTALRPFHAMQVAQAVYAELLRTAPSPWGMDLDYPWVSQGLSRRLARQYITAAQPETRSVQDWIELFNIFAIVDRFESAPKIPFVDTFFEHATQADTLHEQILTFNSDLPPGQVILGKLQQRLGPATFDAVAETCVRQAELFRACAAAVSGQDLSALFVQWVQPYPQLNYRLASTQLNQRDGDGFTHTLTIRRDADRDVHEAVPVQLRSIGGQPLTLRWDGADSAGQVTAQTAQRVYQVVIDPQRELIETTRADNASPPTPQLVLDTAEVEVSSTEFGFSALAVGRGRYDYRKDLAVAGEYTNRGSAVHAGGRYHWGTPTDAATYRHNLYAYYTAQALDRSFNDERAPAVRTAGHVNGIGFRYDYRTSVAYDNPINSVNLRLFGDWYDRGFGSDYNYANAGADLVLTHALWTPRTVVAGEVFSGFTQPFGQDVVPLQGRFSLGGSRSIRGIGAEEELGRNLFLLRAEIRQSLYPEIDLNFLDLLVARRVQLRGFVDSGQVSDSAGAIYDPRGYAVGVGAGLGLVYDFLGFFPALAYIEVATRVDRANDLSDVQFLFGTRQAF